MSGVTVRWFDEGHSIVVYDFAESWSWNDLYPAFEQALEMQHSVTHRVDVILEFPSLVGIPPNAISNLVSISKKQPDNLHLSVFLTRASLISAILRVASNLSPVARDYYRTAKTLDEALAIIQDDRATNAKPRP